MTLFNFRGTNPPSDAHARDLEDGNSIVGFLRWDSDGALLDRSSCPVPPDFPSTYILGCTSLDWAGTQLYEFDIALAANVSWWGRTAGIPSRDNYMYDVWTVAMHEFGHAIGIAHNVDGGDSSTNAERAQVMFPRIDPGTRKRYLGKADRAALCHIYSCCRLASVCSACAPCFRSGAAVGTSGHPPVRAQIAPVSTASSWAAWVSRGLTAPRR